MFGLFDSLFDFNHDGELDSVERAMQMEFISSTEDSENEDYETTELMDAGIDPEDLEFMDEEERREILEDAGLNPDEFDF